MNKKRTSKGIMRIGNLDASAALEKTKKFAINVDNLEIVRMQERLDELNEDLSDNIIIFNPNQLLQNCRSK